jgi:dihydrolipoamide dehydrogenase
MNYDVIVIGAGPGGYVAAIKAAQLGFKVALVEKDQLGGTCLNTGCVPTKSFAAAAEKLNGPINIKQLVEKKNKITATLRMGISQLIKSNKIDYVKGAASFVSSNEIKITGEPGNNLSLKGNHFIIASGSAWQAIKGLQPDGKFIVTSDEMLNLNDLPAHLLIVGGGVIGCEFASIMAFFGVQVAIVEIADTLLPMEDAAISKALASYFKKRGIKIYNKTTVASAADGSVMLSTGETLKADKVLISVGRKPNTTALNVEAAGVKIENGFVLTDERMRTNVNNVFAIGDAAKPKNGNQKPQLAHVASHEGIVAVNNIKKQGHPISYSFVPRPIFTYPEIGCVGLTEQQLKNKKQEYKIGRYPYAALAKALCDEATDGFLQVYIGPDDHILGAHCIGAHATDICAEIALAMSGNLTADDVIDTIHAHPTYSEIIVEAFADSKGIAIHKANKGIPS